jgi:hypothetical protein
MKPFTRIAVVVLWLNALVQLLRFILRWEVTLNGAPVALWLRTRCEINGPDAIALPTGWEGSCSSSPRETDRAAGGRPPGWRD